LLSQVNAVNNLPPQYRTITLATSNQITRSLSELHNDSQPRFPAPALLGNHGQCANEEWQSKEKWQRHIQDQDSLDAS
jgi:hypothetical protein